MSAHMATAMQPVRGSVYVRQNSTDQFEQFDNILSMITRRALELFERKNHLLDQEFDDWLAAETELLYPVHIELAESDKEFKLHAEVPGFNAKDLEIKVEPRCLRIVGRRHSKETNGGKQVRSEWHADQILRAVGLPADVDTARVNAILKDGILVVELPKAPHSKSMHIEPRSD